MPDQANEAPGIRVSTSEVDGEGARIRSFCYVYDLVEGIIRFMKKPLATNDPTNRQPNVAYTKECMNGCEPKMQLEDELQHNIAYFGRLLSGG